MGIVGTAQVDHDGQQGWAVNIDATKWTTGGLAWLCVPQTQQSQGHHSQRSVPREVRKLRAPPSPWPCDGGTPGHVAEALGLLQPGRVRRAGCSLRAAESLTHDGDFSPALQILVQISP